MEFEWDPGKRTANIQKHGLDFADAELVFSGPHIRGDAKVVQGEHREMATGTLEAMHVTVVFTMRGDTIRMISFRRADNGERRRYQQIFGR